MQGSSSLEESDLVAGMEDLKLTSKGGRPLTLTPEQVHSCNQTCEQWFQGETFVRVTHLGFVLRPSCISTIDVLTLLIYFRQHANHVRDSQPAIRGVLMFTSICVVQLRTMTREQLVDIWRDYINQLAVLLVELERGDNATAADTIKQYVEEVVRPNPHTSAVQ